ncbi:dUTP diphosphatase [Desulfohalobium retbaense]|uniref:dUTP diphosphatase n=1 Tax=Desulfohalobium retbaense (strain ATCC 49708 / DSM 5692 / JCM 16813 / HR100) TaxID=485915 RepID=C8X4V5_DESRD|nr:dUTP diphosphatase [Desulfohalobium retbaense]ACV69452.1 deoxyuridine 5'-triphosphate nucleotidohydrolase Dut [Desulfohalobium retbaense DSM 5692]
MRHCIDVDIKLLHELWQDYTLDYATEQSVGLDLRACIDAAAIDLAPGERYAFPSGVALQIREPGYAGFVFSRSGLGTKQGLVVSQGVGVIDPDYRGEILVSLLNTSKYSRQVVRGERIAQLVFLPAMQARLHMVDVLQDTGRGDGGFGHSGRC